MQQSNACLLLAHPSLTAGVFQKHRNDFYRIPFITNVIRRSKGKPFYLFAYAGDEFVVARGKGGGLGLWARAKPAWELQNSVGVY